MSEKGFYDKSSCFHFIQRKLDVFFREKNMIFPSRYFDLGRIFISNTGDDHELDIP